MPPKSDRPIAPPTMEAAAKFRSGEELEAEQRLRFEWIACITNIAIRPRYGRRHGVRGGCKAVFLLPAIEHVLQAADEHREEDEPPPVHATRLHRRLGHMARREQDDSTPIGTLM